MSNEFKRVPTCGENDVDLRVATEPRRVTDAVLPQIIAAKDGEIAALTAEVTHLAEKLADARHQFKNFHRSLCARFGYTHDEHYWWRDLVSLEEAIANKVEAVSAPSVDLQKILEIATWLDSQVNYQGGGPEEPPQPGSQFNYDLAQAASELIAIANATPQPVDAAQAVPEAWIRKTDITELTDSEPETEGWTPLYAITKDAP